MDTARRNQIIRLIAIWGTSLLLSVSAMGLSAYTFTRDRIDYSCETSGHSYEPRYDTIPPSAGQITDMKFSWSSDKMKALELLKQEVYVGDVCHYCGKTVKRN